MGRSIARRAALFVQLVLGCILSFAGQAAATSAQEAIRQQQILEQREEQRRRELERKHLENLQRPPEETPAPPAEKPAKQRDERCVMVREIVLEGVTLLAEAEQDALTEPYLDRCLTLDDINALVGDITNAYIAKGYVTARAAVPQQDLSSGVLRILVVEGRVEGIEPRDPAPYGRRKLALAFPGLTGEHLNIRDIEQGLDQLNRLPSNDASVELVPGTEAGTSRVVIANTTDKTWRASVGVDNSGQESTGEVQYLLDLDKDNLLELNDLLTLDYNADLDSMLHGERQASQSLNTFYSFIFGYWTFTANWSRFDYRTMLEGPGGAFSSAGTTTTTALSADYVFHRDADSKSSVGLGFTLRDTQNYLAGARSLALEHACA